MPSYRQPSFLRINAWLNGCKGITTFRAAAKHYGILKDNEPKAEAYVIDPDTGQKTCE
tara:strand:- start:308 stop:481 length:174 start_codon:yes stop_codon:yes gene_type:complete